MFVLLDMATALFTEKVKRRLGISEVKTEIGRRSYGTQKPLVKDIYKPIDDVIGILLQFQGQRSTLAYFKNGEYLFEIYTGMTGEVTPAVELYESPAQVTLMRYMNLSASGDPVAHVKKLWNTNKSGSSSAYFM